MKIRKYYCKFLLVLVLAGFLPVTSVLAQQYERSRKLKQTYPITEQTSVQVISKYGNIHVLPWDKDSISFEIDIKVEGNKQSKVDKTYDNIEIEFSESSYYVIAQTIFGNKKNAFWADVSDFTSSMLNSGSNAQIDYTVYLPKNAELSVELKFGSIYMTDHSGKAVINISNGDFRGGNFTQLDLDHSFGNVVIDTIQSGNLVLGYSELKLDHAGEIRITSKSSKPNINSFQSIRLNSTRDTYYFKNAGTLNGETSFSYITIEELNGDLIMNTRYGNLMIDKYGKEFSLMNLAAAYTDISMICGEESCYNIEIYYNGKTRMIYPLTQPSFTVKDIDSDEGDYLLSGKFDGAGDDVMGIKITIDGGSVNLVQN